MEKSADEIVAPSPPLPELTARRAGEIFAEVAVLLELQGENQFRVRAYESAARLLSSLTLSLTELLGAVRAGTIRGIGSGLQGALEEMVAVGEYSLLEELRASFPAGIFELLRVSGLGPKKLRLLRSELGIEDLQALIDACDQGRLSEVRGFSEKSQQNMREAALRLLEQRGRATLPAAWSLADRLLEKVEAVTGKGPIITGAFRRGVPVVEAIDVLLPSQSDRSQATTTPVVLAEEELLPVRVHVTEDAVLSLLCTTGSDVHLEQLAARAASLGLAFRTDGLLRGNERLALTSEEELYERLELAPIPPELREGRGEIETAARLFREKSGFDLITLGDISGIIHVHSTYSDGAQSIRELANAAMRRGCSYLGITDHSQSAAYAGGLKVPAVRKQAEEIAALNAELAPFRIFHGIESDILADGALDYPEEVLSQFDFIIASVHSRFSLDRETMTKRLVAAVRNPFTSILGHPTGRKLLEREPYEVDLEAVLDAAAVCGVAVELNANPKRLDLDWQLLAEARDRGISIPVTPDAHSVAGFDDLRWGILMARKGGLRARDVLNTSSAAEFAAWCEARRARR